MAHERRLLEFHAPPCFVLCLALSFVRLPFEAAAAPREAEGGAAANIEGEVERDTLVTEATEGEEEIFHDAAQDSVEHAKGEGDAAQEEEEEARSVAVKIQQVPEDEVCWQTLGGTDTGCLFGRAAQYRGTTSSCGRAFWGILASKVRDCLLVSRRSIFL